MKFQSAAFLFVLVSMMLVTACGGGNEKEEIEPTAEGIFINEISASGDDWMELYNALTTTVDLSGYQVSDNGNEYLIPSGTSIEAGGYLVLLCNDLGTGLNTNFKLSASGEKVLLKNSSGTLIDVIEYPNLDNGQSYGRFPDGSDSWEITGAPTQGTANGGENTPAINSISHLPVVPSLNDDVTVSAELISIEDVTEVILYYNFKGEAFTSLEMKLVSETTYSASIPSMGSDGEVTYYVEAKGSNGVSTFKPASAPENTEDYLLNSDELPLLVINEFMAINTACCADTDGTEPEYDDWIEIHNMGSTALNLAGMYFSNDLVDPFGDKISNDDASLTTIPAGGFLLFWADGSTDQGPLHLNFSLNGDGEEIGLYYIDGRVIDTYTFGAQVEDVSYGRESDGTDIWRSFTSPTPGASNN
ncbi:MAG: lamin tail domain-containing protein [Cyclobacteriaceae bacterium]